MLRNGQFICFKKWVVIDLPDTCSQSVCLLPHDQGAPPPLHKPVMTLRPHGEPAFAARASAFCPTIKVCSVFSMMCLAF